MNQRPGFRKSLTEAWWWSGLKRGGNKASEESDLILGLFEGLDDVLAIGGAGGRLNHRIAQRQALCATRPTESIESDGKEVLVYHAELANSEGDCRLEARADAATRRLQSLKVTRQHDGQPPRVATLAVLAVNQPVSQDKFVVRDTLTEDGRVGKVVDAQGIVTVKPVMHRAGPWWAPMP